MNYNFIVFTAICMVMLMLMPGTSAVGEPPSIPESFDGTVTVNGKLAQDGTVVSAFIDDMEVANAATVNGTYEFEVPGSEGDTITFKVYDVVATTAAWNKGRFTELDLSAEGVVVPESIGASVDSAAPSTTSTPTPTVTADGDISTEPPTGASAERQEAASTDVSGDSAAPSTTSTPTPTVIVTDGDISTEPPTGASAERQEAASTVDRGEKPTSSIPGFAGVTAVFVLLMLFWRRRNSEQK